MIFFGKKKILLAMLIFAFMALGGWFWKHREFVPFVSQPLAVVTAPFEYSVSRISLLGKTGIGIIDQSVQKWAELDELKKENAGLKAEQAGYSEILAENIRLRELLRFREGYKKYTLLGASIIAKDYGTWTNTMIIDGGTDREIKKYMPVIVPQGVVGFVSEVYANTSRVQLLTDPRTTIGGIVQRPAARVASMVSGNSGKPGELSFINIEREADVVKGDVIITSGYGGVYPKGLVIGSIDKISSDTEKVSLDADIKPAVDFGHIEEVFIILDSIQKTSPEDITTKAPYREPPMNPNVHQAGDKNG